MLLPLSILAVVVGAGAGIVALRVSASRERQAERVADDIQLGVARLSEHGWQATSTSGATRPPHRQDALGKTVKGQLVELERAFVGELPDRRRTTRRLDAQLGAYLRSLDLELERVGHGPVAPARRFQRQRATRRSQALDQSLTQAALELERSAATRERQADFGLLALLTMLTLGGWLVRRSSRAAHSAQMRALEERSLRASEETFRTLVHNASDMIAVVDPNGVIRNLTGSVAAVLGDSWSELIGENMASFVHSSDVSAFESLLARASIATRRESSTEVRMLSVDGVSRHVEVIATNLMADPHVGGLVLTVRDVSSRKELEEQLRHRAFHDPLTQLPNRALFYDRVEHALATEGRDEQLNAVLFMDIDDFKTMNDRFGHAGGDELLVEVARRLHGCLRPADTAARLGGDEFGVLLESVPSPSDALAVAKRILAAFDEPIFVHGEAAMVRASVGIAVSAPSDLAAEGLLRKADFAMYAAKGSGKNRYELFDAELEKAIGGIADGRADRAHPGRLPWVLGEAEQREEILYLLEQPGALEILYQPVVDLHTGLVAGYEALSRFRERGQRSPATWFAEARRCGLGAQLEAAALHRAIAREDRPRGAFLSVNLSPSALTSQDVRQELPARLEGLVIEITENELVAEGKGVLSAVQELRERGARLAVDDAGAGYAGLKHLTQLRPDLIKLDRALIDGIHADSAKAALVDAMVRYAREIGAAVCAEGIESLHDLEALANLDVTYGQGFVLARPTPPWASVSPAAVEICSTSLGAFMRHEELSTDHGAYGDVRFERLSRRIFEADSIAELDGVMELVAAELHADDVCCSRFDPEGLEVQTVAVHGWSKVGEHYLLEDFPATAHVLRTGDAVQVLTSDPAADRAEVELMAGEGVRALLMVPLTSGRRMVGLLEVGRRTERPWTRTDIHRARIVAYQLGAAMETLDQRYRQLRPIAREDLAVDATGTPEELAAGT